LLLTFSAIALANYYAVIDHSELKTLVDADARTFLLIDARNPEEYCESHTPGAIKIPVKKFERLTDLLPANKNMRLIFYCNGIKCGKSKKAAKQANDLGYTNILVFAEGMPVWEELGYSFCKSGDFEKRIEPTKVSTNALKTLDDSQPENIRIIDVRVIEEFTEGHIPGAINQLPSQHFCGKVQSSGQADKNRRLLQLQWS